MRLIAVCRRERLRMFFFLLFLKLLKMNVIDVLVNVPFTSMTFIFRFYLEI